MNADVANVKKNNKNATVSMKKINVQITQNGFFQRFCYYLNGHNCLCINIRTALNSIINFESINNYRLQII